MDCLELNIHQQILSDLASSVIVEDGASLASTKSIIESKVVITKAGQDVVPNGSDDGEDTSRMFMSASRVHCNIAYGELAIHFPTDIISEHTSTLIPTLIDILRGIPRTEFDQCLSWDEWSLPDQLVFSTVSALLRIAH
ncbi:hypothetical protein SERLADRAFT_475890, partial [Serpula lacrymans var. lacrymans S7.9]